MRDRRFVAEHRGGPLSREDHVRLAQWAVECAEEALPIFQKHSKDSRPALALEIARAWAKGEMKTGAAMKASVAAHAAAREVKDPAASAAARAAAQAVATAHFADHCMGALLYLLRAIEIGGRASGESLERHLGRLPECLRAPVSEGVLVRLKPLGIKTERPV
jgi:hypothetical protein